MNLMYVTRSAALISSVLAVGSLLAGCERDWSGPSDELDAGDAGGLDSTVPVPPDGATDASDTGAGGESDGGKEAGLPNDPAPVSCGALQCLHGGTCVVTGAMPSCQCPAGWTGLACADDVDECKGSHGCPTAHACDNLPGGYTCLGELADFPLPKGNTLRAVGEFERGDRTVLDKLTGLRWQTDISTAADRTWPQANSDCADATTGGFTDWRLPSYLELMTLVHGVTSNDVEGYPNNGNHVFAELRNGNNFNLWTLTLDNAQKHVFQWYYNGWWANWPPEGPVVAAVRCVRRDQIKCLLAPDKRFARQGGSLVDACTKLAWAYDPSPAIADFAAATAYCSALKTDGRTWRVPSYLELFSIVASARNNGFVSGLSVPRGFYATTTREVVHLEDGGVPMTDQLVVLDNNDWDTWGYAKSNGQLGYARCVSEVP